MIADRKKDIAKGNFKETVGKEGNFKETVGAKTTSKRLSGTNRKNNKSVLKKLSRSGECYTNYREC